MTTAIAAIKTISFPALAPDSRQMAVMKQNLDGEAIREMDLVRVRTPLGGATQWTVEVDGNTTVCEELTGVLVGIAKRGYLWPAEDPSEMRPVLVTHDLRHAYRVSDDLGDINPASLERYREGDRRYNWAALSASKEFGFGAGRGAAKRCKESRILAILRDGETWPILVTAGPGSLATVVPWLRRLPCYIYEAVISLRLVRAKGSGGQPYSQIVPRLAGMLSAEQAEVARLTWHACLQEMFSAPPSGAADVAYESSED